ncbi:MAG: hypothetical protein J7M18_08320, partial [Candidatus Eremiobacteraeota bacterium]|nr:hypothetical protein [Candidatus Eremiobacteraeota bacterium]
LSVETISRDYIIANYRPRDWRSVGDKKFNLEERNYDPVSGRMNSRMILVGPGIFREHELSLRLYSLPELIEVFKNAGFDYVRAYDSTTGEDYDMKSSRILLVMEKRVGQN